MAYDDTKIEDGGATDDGKLTAAEWNAMVTALQNPTVTSLDDVGDVTITSVASGEVIKWNGSAWINQTLSEAAITSTTATETQDMNGNNITNIKGTSFNETDDGNSGAADTIDWSAGAFHKSTLTANTTYTFTDPFTGGTNYTRLQLKIVQDATGGFDVTWPSNVVWPEGEPTWTDGTANQKIIVTFVYDDGDDDYIGQATSWYT